MKFEMIVVVNLTSEMVLAGSLIVRTWKLRCGRECG